MRDRSPHPRSNQDTSQGPVAGDLGRRVLPHFPQMRQINVRRQDIFRDRRPPQQNVRRQRQTHTRREHGHVFQETGCGR